MQMGSHVRDKDVFAHFSKSACFAYAGKETTLVTNFEFWEEAEKMGWLIGLEPTTTGITIRGSTN